MENNYLQVERSKPKMRYLRTIEIISERLCHQHLHSGIYKAVHFPEALTAHTVEQNFISKWGYVREEERAVFPTTIK